MLWEDRHIVFRESINLLENSREEAKSKQGNNKKHNNKHLHYSQIFQETILLSRKILQRKPSDKDLTFPSCVAFWSHLRFSLQRQSRDFQGGPGPTDDLIVFIANLSVGINTSRSIHSMAIFHQRMDDSTERGWNWKIP